MPYRLTITDNETGETLRDLDCNCIIGTAHISEGEAAGIFVSSCTCSDVAATVVATENILQHIEQKDPRLLLAKLMVGTKLEKAEN